MHRVGRSTSSASAVEADRAIGSWTLLSAPPCGFQVARPEAPSLLQATAINFSLLRRSAIRTPKPTFANGACWPRPSAEQRVEDGGFMRRRRGLAGGAGRGVTGLVDRIVRHIQRAFHATAGQSQCRQHEECHHPANLPTAPHLSRFNPVHSRQRQRRSHERRLPGAGRSI